VRVHEIDVSGLAVAPGFINMLSWANESLIEDRPFGERHSAGRHA
jgi:N-acyl-D-aspartate/D-glutamate deacylase